MILGPQMNGSDGLFRHCPAAPLLLPRLRDISYVCQAHSYRELRPHP